MTELLFLFINKSLVICSMNTNKDVILGSGATGKTPALFMKIVAKGKTALITIKGNISSWRNSSSDIEAQISSVVKKGVTSAEIYINSGGGDVFEANEILNLIEDNFTNITVRVGALCASAATIFIAKYPTTAKKNSKIMIHKPYAYASGNEDKIGSTLKLLQEFTADYKKMYADKMKMSLKGVEELWAKGDYWLTAKEALKKGLINSIEDIEAPIDAETRLQLVACGAPNIPEKKQNPKDNNIMEKARLIAMLGLDPDATDAQIEAKIKANKTAAEKTANLEAQAKANLENAQTAKIKALLDDAEKDKKINAAQRTNYEILAKSDFDNTKSIIDAITPITAISEQIDGNGATASADQNKWTYEDYQKNEAMADFEKLPEDKQKTLINAFYKE